MNPPKIKTKIAAIANVINQTGILQAITLEPSKGQDIQSQCMQNLQEILK